MAPEYASARFTNADLAKKIIVVIHFSHQYFSGEKGNRFSSDGMSRSNLMIASIMF
jgi:hypothetical protein